METGSTMSLTYLQSMIRVRGEIERSTPRKEEPLTNSPFGADEGPLVTTVQGAKDSKFTVIRGVGDNTLPARNQVVAGIVINTAADAGQRNLLSLNTMDGNLRVAAQLSGLPLPSSAALLETLKIVLQGVGEKGNVVLGLDGSGSMRNREHLYQENYYGGQELYQVARDLVGSAAEELTAKHNRVAVVEYSGVPRVIQQLNAHPLNAEQRARFQEKLAAWEPQGSVTNDPAAIQEGVDIFARKKAEPPKTVLLFTDCETNTGNLPQALEAAEKSGTRVIAIGLKPKPEDMTRYPEYVDLAELAKAPRGLMSLLQQVNRPQPPGEGSIEPPKLYHSDTADSRDSEDSRDFILPEARVLETPTTVDGLGWCGRGLVSGKPTLLTGPRELGKTSRMRYLSALTANALTEIDLRQVTDGAKVAAALHQSQKEGTWIVLDHLDAASPAMQQKVLPYLNPSSDNARIFATATSAENLAPQVRTRFFIAEQHPLPTQELEQILEAKTPALSHKVARAATILFDTVNMLADQKFKLQDLLDFGKMVEPVSTSALNKEAKFNILKPMAVEFFGSRCSNKKALDEAVNVIFNRDEVL